MGYPRRWEQINDDKEAGCARLKIFGGWLVVAWVNSEKALPENVIFIFDPLHFWELEEA